MKVLSSTPDQLMLGARPWVLGAMLGVGGLAALGTALSFLLAGAPDQALAPALVCGVVTVAMLMFMRRVVVILDRPSGEMVWRQATLLGQTEQRRPLAQVTGATVEVSSGRAEGETNTYRPALVLADGTQMPLITVFVSGRGPERAVQAINDWLAAARA